MRENKLIKKTIKKNFTQVYSSIGITERWSSMTPSRGLLFRIPILVRETPKQPKPGHQ